MLATPPLSLYVHLPWCVRKCPYCDFNSHEQRGALQFEAYVDALIADLDHDLPLAWGRTVQTVFFGGGTPSLFPPAAIDRFLQLASARLRFAPNAEVTLETNPGTVEHGPFAGYRTAGVNRLSFGVQSFDDGCLQRLGRIHSSGEAERAVKAAQDAGFDNCNLDLAQRFPGLRTSLTELLQYPGVLQGRGLDQEALQREVLALLDVVLADFVATREREGGRMNTLTASGIRERTWRAPCQSISSSTSRPAISCGSTDCRAVPFQSPCTRACSKKSPVATIASNSSALMKW